MQNSIFNIRIFAQNQHKRKWSEQIQDENSNLVLRTYRLFKNNHCMESYLSQVKDNKYRICLTKFRVSSQRSRIEVGRHQRPKLPLEQRICSFCNINEIDDAVHLVKNCQFHNEERRILLNEIQRHFNSINYEYIFTPLVQSDCFKVQHAFGKFLYSCFYNRQQTLAKSLNTESMNSILSLKHLTMYLLVQWCCRYVLASHCFILELSTLCTMIFIFKIDRMYLYHFYLCTVILMLCVCTSLNF